MSRQIITIAHLYPQEMNIYGDFGNVATLVKRLEWRGYEAVVKAVEIDKAFDFSSIDIIFGGGGQDRGQSLVGHDLLARGPELKAAAAAGMPMLMVCGLYQLFGHGFTTASGEEIAGIGIFDARTEAGPTRMIGNIVLESSFGKLVGFENHSGRTLLAPGQVSLGKVTSGYGNNNVRRSQRHEGARSNNVIGTYLHGPILPKNPVLADFLIATAIERRYQQTELSVLDDQLEHSAAVVAATRPQ